MSLPAARIIFACMLTLSCVGGAWAQPAPAPGPAVPLPPFSTAPGGPWHFATLPHKTPTRFEPVQLDGHAAVKVDAEGSYGMLVHPIQLAVEPGTLLRWNWRVDTLVEGADLRHRGTDDGIAKVCVFFAFPVERLPVAERVQLALARSTSGEDVPAEALCYVWDNQLPPGTELPNAFTQRLRMVVLQSGPARLGQWVAQRRDLYADYRQAFGGEAGDLPPQAVAVAIVGDADNTRGHGLGYVADLALVPPRAPAAAAGGKTP